MLSCVIFVLFTNNKIVNPTNKMMTIYGAKNVVIVTCNEKITISEIEEMRIPVNVIQSFQSTKKSIQLNKKVKCKVCGKLFENMVYLKKHINLSDHHYDKNVPEQQVKPRVQPTRRKEAQQIYLSATTKNKVNIASPVESASRSRSMSRTRSSSIEECDETSIVVGKRHKVRLDNLGRSITEDDVRLLCEEYGSGPKIIRIRLVTGYETSKAFIIVENQKVADDLIVGLDGRELDGRRLIVQHATKPKKL